MKSLSKTRREPGIWLTEIDTPAIGPNDVLIAITKTAICGTDMHIYHWDEWAQATIPVPMTIGHEYVGKVAAHRRRSAGLPPRGPRLWRRAYHLRTLSQLSGRQTTSLSQ